MEINKYIFEQKLFNISFVFQLLKIQMYAANGSNCGVECDNGVGYLVR